MTADRDRVLALLRRHGRDASAFQALEPGLRYWFDDDACVAYAEAGRAWVVAGGPVCARPRVAAVAAAFTAAAAAARRRVRWFGVDAAFCRATGLAALDVGRQPVWNPRRWPAHVASKRSLREQLRRARAKGVRVRAATPAEATGELRAPLQRLIDLWLRSRAMAPLGFVVRIEPFAFAVERRYFVAERGGVLIGTLIAVPIHARAGWLLEDALRDPSAPNGTMELLFDLALRTLAAEGSPHVTFGLAPLAGTRSRWLRAIGRLGRPLYDFEGLYRFKRKLDPDHWHAVHLAFASDQRGVGAVADVLRAFAGGSFTGFAWRTALHRAPAMAAALAALLLPWTLLLAAASERWFPAPAVRTWWIALDALLIAGLTALALRWRPWLAGALAIAALADCALGCAQAAVHNLPRARGVVDHAVIAAALLAPAAAAAFLWAARHARPRRRKAPNRRG